MFAMISAVQVVADQDRPGRVQLEVALGVAQGHRDIGGDAWMATISTASARVGLTLPGMIEDRPTYNAMRAGCQWGSLSSTQDKMRRPGKHSRQRRTQSR